MTQGDKQNSEMVAPVTGITLWNDVIEIVEHAQGGAEKVDKPRDSNLVSSCLVDTLSQYSLHGEKSKTEETNPNHNLSLILNQADNFENQLKEIDSKIQKFESRNKSLSDNNLEISNTVSKGQCIERIKEIWKI